MLQILTKVTHKITMNRAGGLFKGPQGQLSISLFPHALPSHFY